MRILFLSLLILVCLCAPIFLNAQTPKPTTTTTPAPTTTVQGPNNLNSLDFERQKAYLYVLPPQGAPTASATGSDQTTIYGLIGTAITGAFAIYTKISSKRDHEENKVKAQDNAAEIVQSRTVEHSIAKQMYDFAPEDKLQAMEGSAPETRLTKLQENTEKAVQNAAKK
jgi:hypothetical protein